MGNILAYTITASQSGTLQTIGLDVQSASGSLAVAIYSTLTGTPTLTGLLGQSSSIAAAAGWNDLSIPGSVSIVQGSTYYLAFQCSSNSLAVYGPASGTQYGTGYAYGSFPSTTSTLSTSTQTLNMRMTYSTAGSTITSTATIVGSSTLTSSTTTAASPAPSDVGSACAPILVVVAAGESTLPSYPFNDGPTT